MEINRIGLLAKEMIGGVGTIVDSILDFNSDKILYFGLLLKNDKHSLYLKKKELKMF